MKTNEMFVRKCQSMMPRFENRGFRIAFEAERHLAVINIKPSSSKQLTVFFEALQQFFIDHDLVVTPLMPGGGDLLVRFAPFQLKHGLYAGSVRYEFLRGIVNEFWHYDVVEKYTPPTSDKHPVKRKDHNYVANMLGFSDRVVNTTHGQHFVLRRRLGIITSEEQHGHFHSVPYSSWPSTEKLVLETCSDPELIVMDYMPFAKDATLSTGCVGYATTVPYFMDMLRERGYMASEVDVTGSFIVRKA